MRANCLISELEKMEDEYKWRYINLGRLLEKVTNAKAEEKLKEAIKFQEIALQKIRKTVIFANSL